jgi:membrane fusion protein (multidrug efflux system)
MKPVIKWIVVVLVVAAAAVGGYWLGHRGAASGTPEGDAHSGADANAGPIANVTVVPLRQAAISADIVAYGTIVAPPNEISVVSVPFESRVSKILVAPGETVKAGQSLAEVEGSAATVLAVEEAKNSQAAAERDLQAVKQRYDQKLATNAELYTAQNTLRTAQGKLKSLQQGGAGAPAQLKSESPGIVSKVDVQIGQVVPIGAPLVEVVAQNRIEAHLGAEPEDAESLAAGKAVELQPIDDPDAKPVAGTIRMVGRQVDPITRLVDVFVSLPPDVPLLLQAYVIGTIRRVSSDGFVAPRDAALPEGGGGYTLFTVKDGKAVKHSVRVGIENNRDVQVVGDGLKEGDLVITSGNLELDDGMAVQANAEAPPTQSSSAQTSPAQTSPAQTQPEASEGKP